MSIIAHLTLCTDGPWS